MSVAFRSAAHNNNYYSSGTLTITKPTGTANGDILIAIIGGSPSTLAGWTAFGSAASGTSLDTVGIFWKKAASEGASYSWTITSSSDTWGVIAAYSGCDPTTPVDTTDKTTGFHSGTAFTPSNVTTTANQTLVAWAMEYKFDASSSATTTWTVTGATSRDSNSIVQGGSPANEEISYVICDKVPSAGSNTQTLTASQSSDGGVSGIILLNAAGTSASAGAAAATAAANGITATLIPGAQASQGAATAAGNGPTVTIVNGIGTSSASNTAAAYNASVAIGVSAGSASATAAGVITDRGHVVDALSTATAAAHNAIAQPGEIAHAGVASVTVSGKNTFYVGIGVFPGCPAVAASAYNIVALFPGETPPIRTYYVPIDLRIMVADPSDTRIFVVPPDA